MSRTPDFAVIGSGPNGLAAACTLARLGYAVTVLEANPERPGGAVWSTAATLPGFVHDEGAGFFTFGTVSPAFRELDLERHGVRWLHAPIESCHPALDGSVASIARLSSVATTSFGSARDAETWREMAEWHRGVEDKLVDLLLGALPPVRPVLRLGPAALLRITRMFTSSSRGLAERSFESEAARRVLPSLGLHVDVGPDDVCGAGLGYMLGLTAATAGYAVPEGGARAVTQAMLSILTASGGTLRLGARVTSIVLRDGRARAVRTASGDEIEVERGVLADTAAASLFLDLVDRAAIPERVVRAMLRFRHGWGTFKLDWALSAPVPWQAAEARASAVVHTGESVDDLARFTEEVRAGRLPERPYLVVGQQSLADPSRAPAGRHTLWAYSRVPSNPAGGWSACAEEFADRVEQRIEGLAPGFRAGILARRVVTPCDLEAMDANLVGGDLGGGSNAWHRQLFFRPVFPYFRYRTPVPGLYLCSSYAHPGAGVHGMCGYNAAQVAARDLG